MARGSCLDCTRKHIAQAMVFMDESAANGERQGPISEINRHIAQAIILLQESRLGYKFHRWFASGHLAIAESMMLTDDPSRDVETLRSCRLDIMSGNTTDLRDWLAPRYRRTMAVAHLMEAESESRREHPELAAAIRRGRAAEFQHDRGGSPLIGDQKQNFIAVIDRQRAAVVVENADRKIGGTVLIGEQRERISKL